ncbi:MAG: carbohydrate ABC transporter permease [Cellulosilyticaceae bacterium]
MGDYYTKNKVVRLIFHIFMIGLSIMMVYPFIWAVCSSFKTTGQLYNETPLNLIANPFTLDNYKRTWEVLPFDRFLMNSLFLSIAIPLLMILLSSLCGYAFARLEFKGKNIIFLLILASMMIPSHVTLIPNFSIIRKLGWVDKYIALFVNSLFTGANAFNIFFFKQYFMSIPKDLEDAAIIDGCNRAKVYFSIIMPNSKPAIATVAILSFRSVWNSFLWPMIVINSYEKMTITVGLQYYKGVVNNWCELLAGTTIAIIPVIVVFLIFQKYFIKSTVNSGFGGV